MTDVSPIRVFHRYTGRVEEEPVYGERWLRWTYETAPGRLLLGLLAKRVWLSRFYGWLMSRPKSVVRIGPFIEKYRIDTSEFAAPPESFATFNDFFSRQLRPGVRPINADPAHAVFPADGRHLGLQNFTSADSIYVKGQQITCRKLLGNGELERAFNHGSMVISRLCPVDYHRFHCPVAGELRQVREIPGPLFSVNPIALRMNLGYLTANKHTTSIIETKGFGRVAMIEIGATFVGTIVQTASPGAVEKGAEKGHFRFGGSCVVTIFEPGRITLAKDLVGRTRARIELYARMGDVMGTAR